MPREGGIKGKGRYRVLVAVYWPLGGIRTYMKYVYRYLPSTYQVTVLAASTQEDDALRENMAEVGAVLILYHGQRRWFFLRIFRELIGSHYDLIQSHGFISATHVYFANLMRIIRVPHILTVHGMLENRFLTGLVGRLKTRLLYRIVRQLDVVYAVGQDMMTHLGEEIPGFNRARCRKTVIKNGIDVQPFAHPAHPRGSFRKSIGVADDAFLIGYLGRFMQLKGFNFLIDAVALLEEERALPENVRIVAVGSGDYLDRYRRDIVNKRLEHRFIFIPFQRDISTIYPDLDAVAMPSIAEAASLLALESLCAGTPLLASNCIGLRESVRDTPTVTFESQNARALANAMLAVVQNPNRPAFEAFRPHAFERFDIRLTSAALDRLFRETVGEITDTDPQAM